MQFQLYVDISFIFTDSDGNRNENRGYEKNRGILFVAGGTKIDEIKIDKTLSSSEDRVLYRLRWRWADISTTVRVNLRYFGRLDVETSTYLSS